MTGDGPSAGGQHAGARLVQLGELAAALLSATSREAVADVILDRGAEALGATTGVLLYLDPESERLIVGGSHGSSDRELAPWRDFPLSVASESSEAARTGAPVFVETVEEWARRYPALASAPVGPLGARVALPLLVEGRVIGVLGFGFAGDRRFDAEDRAFAMVLAQKYALALERARLFDAERAGRARLAAAARRLELRQRVAAALVAKITPADVARLVVDDVRRALGSTAAIFVAPAPGGERLALLAHGGLDPSLAAELASFSVDAQIPAAIAYRTGERVWLPSPPLASLSLPLLARRGVIGAIAFMFDRAHALDAEDLDHLEELAHTLALAFDLTRLFAALEDKTRTLEAYVDASPAATTLFDLDGTVRGWNPAAERMFGWSAAEVVGRFLPAALPEQHDEVVAHLTRIAQGELLRGIETQRVRKDGSVVDVSLFASPVALADGRVQCLSIAVDISDRKRAEGELRRAHAIALEADRRKDEFLAMLGHELRNPLAPIAIALDLVRLEKGADIERELAVIDRQVRHVVSLVDDLLDVSRITRGKITLHRRPREIAPVLSRAIEITSPLLEKKRHALRVDVPADGLVVNVDETRMAQVLANLLTNAAKYTDAGGNITVHARREEEQVVIGVRDDGIGVAPDLLPVMFELFVQGERGADRAGGGLGLGLAIVRSLVGLHGGTVSAHSAGPGLGSEFVVRLPAHTGEGAKAGAASLRRSVGIARRVVVVDDNHDAALLLADLLRAHGNTVALAHDGPQTLSLVRSFQPDVAVLDIGLPVMDGYELACELRAAVGPDLRLIAVTGYGQEHDRQRAHQAGFSHHFVKPVDAAALLECVMG
jgi:PAS domain S-box-containing protein